MLKHVSRCLVSPALCCLTLVTTTCSAPSTARSGGSPATTTAGAGLPDTTVPPGSATVLLNEDLGSRQIFPTDNWWNQDVSQAPVDPNSDLFIGFIGGSKGMHPDFGPPPYGIPIVTVGKDQPRLAIGSFMYAGESDLGAPGQPAGYPIPDEARTKPNYIEGGVPGGGDDGDRHLILVDRDRWLLFELFATTWNASTHKWDAGSGAVFNLASNDRRPEGWTSADAAGLAIMPGLVRYEDAYGSGPVTHAFRFTVRATNGFVWPASHKAGQTTGAPPLGARLRLKAAVDLSGFSPPMRRIFEAMKTYGLILADNGSDMFVSGAMDPRWNNDELNPAFRRIRASDFDVIRLGWR